MINDDRIDAQELSHYGLRPWSPRNLDGSYRGWQEAQHGLIASRNTMTVRVGERAGLPAVRDLGHAANLGDPKKSPSRNHPWSTSELSRHLSSMSPAPTPLWPTEAFVLSGT